MKKLSLILLLMLLVITLSACNLFITEGTVVAKIEVGESGEGLEVYGYSGVEAGYYIVVADAEGNKGIFQAKSKISWDKTSVDGAWEYNATNWYIYAGMTTKMTEEEQEDWKNGKTEEGEENEGNED